MGPTMRRSLIAASVIGFLASTPVLAADMALKAPPPPAPAFSWTGFYIGLNAGGAWGTANVSFNPTGPFWATAPAGEPAFVAAQGSPRLHGSSFIGGGQAGYNYQTGNVVLGIEADIDYLGLRMSRTTPVFAFPGSASFFFMESVSTNWLATVRPRLGVAADHWLFYATGGLAVGNQNFSESMTFVPALTAAGTTNPTKAGWTAGAGVEYAFTRQLSAKAEYLYFDLGSVGFTTVFPGFPTLFQNISSHLTANIVRVGLNYRFN